MQCPMCKRLRRDGDCEAFDDSDAPTELEGLEMDAEFARKRYEQKLAAEGRLSKGEKP